MTGHPAARTGVLEDRVKSSQHLYLSSLFVLVKSCHAIKVFTTLIIFVVVSFHCSYSSTMSVCSSCVACKAMKSRNVINPSRSS